MKRRQRKREEERMGRWKNPGWPRREKEGGQRSARRKQGRCVVANSLSTSAHSRQHPRPAALVAAFLPGQPITSTDQVSLVCSNVTGVKLPWRELHHEELLVSSTAEAIIAGGRDRVAAYFSRYGCQLPVSRLIRPFSMQSLQLLAWVFAC